MLSLSLTDAQKRVAEEKLPSWQEKIRDVSHCPAKHEDDKGTYIRLEGSRLLVDSSVADELLYLVTDYFQTGATRAGGSIKSHFADQFEAKSRIGRYGKARARIKVMGNIASKLEAAIEGVA